MKKPPQSFRLVAVLGLALSILSWAVVSAIQSNGSISIDAVYFAQSHVLKPENPNFGLVSDREALIKVHLVDPNESAAPAVSALLTLGGQTLTLTLTGPATLPASVPDGRGVVEHTYEDSFTARIPAEWLQPGLDITISAGSETAVYNDLEIGAPNKIHLTMFDVQYFADTDRDYPAGWQEELAEKWPVSGIELVRLPHVVFPELVIPPRAGVGAARVRSKNDYLEQTGLPFDGEQAAALAWNGALKRAAGRRNRLSAYYINIYNVGAGGQASGFSGVGNGTSAGLLNHEMGHAFSLPHWINSSAYPYKGAMYGIETLEDNEVHVGPAWGFDSGSGIFIPPTVQENSVNGSTPGTYKVDPMQGGGSGFQEQGFLMNHFSDYSMNQMRNYLERQIVIWNEDLNSYAAWNSNTGSYTAAVGNNGVDYPITRDVDVITVMASMSGANPDINMVYPPIGPYQTGMIRLFDPRVPADRELAQQIFAPTDGCDYSLRITQGGVEKVYMLAASNDPTRDPTSGGSLLTEAVNLPAADGQVTRIELLNTPNAELNGLPSNAEVITIWSPLTPDVAAFNQVPVSNSSSAIRMSAFEGSLNIDSPDPIEYRFIEISGNPGGSSSAWQLSPDFTDLGLDPSTTYRYTVSMRAGSQSAGTSAALSATTTAPASFGNITVDSTQRFDLVNSGDFQAVTGLNNFDAGDADKLVVVVAAEQRSNNGDGFVFGVRYNGEDLIEAVQEDAGLGRGTAAIFYLDNPGPIGSGTIEVDSSNPNGGIGTAYALSGTSAGVGTTGRSSGSNVDSVNMTTSGDQSLLIAVMNNAGSPNGAGIPTVSPPMTQVSNGGWGSQWSGFATGYQEVDVPSPVDLSFTTNVGAGYSINIAAAEFLSQPLTDDYSLWSQIYPAADLDRPNADFDGDGLSNESERLFGLDPTSSVSVSPFSDSFDRSGSFQYTRRDDALTGRLYTIWTSSSLEEDSWTRDLSSVQVEGDRNPDGIETVTVTVDPALQFGPRLFIRVAVE